MGKLTVGPEKPSELRAAKSFQRVKNRHESPSLFFEAPSENFDDIYVELRQSAEPKKPPFASQEFIGLNFDVATLETLLEELEERVGSETFTYLVTPNVDHLVTLKRNSQDSVLQMAYEKSDLLVCDSRVLSLMAKLSNISLPAIPGSDVTAHMLKRIPHGSSIAVVGGSKKVHQLLRVSYSQFQWQFYAPPMGVRNSERLQSAVVDFVCRAKPDITFLAIGAPQSEIVCQRLKQSGQARGLALCIGASLEFITGQKKRAPIWMQRSSLEWLHRLFSEPHRLAHRYLVKGPTIFIAWLKWIKGRAD